MAKALDGQSSVVHMLIKDSLSHNMATSLAWGAVKKNFTYFRFWYVVGAQGVWVIC